MAGGRFQQFNIDARELTAAAERYSALGPAYKGVLTRTVNWVGARARTQVTKQLAKSMGLPQKELRNFIQTFPALTSEITYTIRGTGRPISLRAFGAVQRAKGVSARPWGERRIFRGTFIVASLGGSVYKRVGSKVLMSKGRYKGQRRQQIEKLWGPAVPQQMADVLTVRAFEKTVREQWPQRLDHEVVRAFEKLRGNR